MTPKQCLNARRLLRIKQSDLAKATGVSDRLISHFERNGHMPRMKNGGGDRLASLKAFLEAAGVQFVDEKGDGAGVRLRKGGE